MEDPLFRRSLEIAIDSGHMLLVESLGEDWNVELQSLIKREVTKFGQTKMIKFCRRQIKYNPNFKLFLATNIA